MQTFRTPRNTLLDIKVEQLIIAGWAARDQASVEAHIKELEELGVQRPSAVPLFYRVAADRLTSAESLQVLGNQSSGEIEAVLISDDRGRLWVGVGSDHTDREVEAYSVAVSKQICPKPISSELWAFEEVAEHWDRLRLRSHVVIEGKKELYQEGTMESLLDPRDLVRRYTGGSDLPPRTALFCGTLTAQGGVRPAPRFEMELQDPVLGRSLVHTYELDLLPVVA
ncbi:MAG TPA: DUF2848 domain-containing protein [Kiloniellales bacterium]|nr:DUF2848 domain-containing protein [Kiloniellales bacterium]